MRQPHQSRAKTGVTVAARPNPVIPPKPARATGGRMSVLELTEKQWLAQVRDLAKLYGWRVYHPWLSIRSEHGFPDLVLANAAQRRLVFAELKTEKGKLSTRQEEWIVLLRACGCEVYVWRPSQLEEVAEILRRKRGD